MTYREALSTPGFAVWLVRNYPDHGSLDYSNPRDQERIVKWFTARAAGIEATPLGCQMYREMFFTDIGIQLSNSVLGAVGKYLTKLAIENPDAVSYYCDKIKRWHEIPREIQRLEEEYAEAGGENRRAGAAIDLESARRSHELRKRARFFSFRRSEEEKLARAYSIAEWRTLVLKFEDELAQLNDFGQRILALKKERWDLKREFFTIRDIVNALLVEIGITVAGKLIDMTKGWHKRSLTELEAAQNYFEKMVAAGAEVGLDYLTDFADPAGFQRNLDQAVRASLYATMKEGMTKQNRKPESVALPAVEAIVDQALTRKQLGSFRDDQAREVVIEVLRDLNRDNAISDAHKLLFRPMAR